MSYAANLLEEGIDGGYLLVIVPRRFVTSTWISQGSGKYNAAFGLGQVVSLTKDDTTLSEVTSAAALTSNTFYYDVDAQLLWAHVGGASPSGYDMVAGYEIYLGTFDAHFYRDPLDDTSRTVYYEPLITKSPSIRQDVSDSLFGYMPAASSQIAIGNATAYLNEHLSEGSLRNAALSLYHYLGELAVENVRRVYQGLIDSIDYKDDEISLRVLDRINIFDREYRHVSDRTFFDETTFPDVDPNQTNRPIRKVFGVVDGVIGVNVDYSKTTSTSTNRFWIMHSGTDDPGEVTQTVIGGSTATRTYLASVDGIRVGDEIFLDNAGGADRYYEVTAVGADYIEHASLGLSAASGSTVYRYFIGNVYVVADGISTRLPGDCWATLIDGSAGVLGVGLNQTAVAAKIGRELGAGDQLYGRVYGQKNTATLGGVSFGSDSSTTGNLTQGAVLLWELLKGPVGLSEDEIDTASFQALQAAASDELGYQLPVRLGDNFPPLREVVTAIGQTMLLKVFLNDDGLWSVARTGPLGSVTKMVDDNELLAGRINYNFDFSEIYSDVFVEFAPTEVSSRGQVGGELSYQTSHVVSQTARRLHRVVRQRTFKSLHFIPDQADDLATKLGFYFGDRRGRMVITSKQRFFDSNVNDVVEVSRTRLPGEAFDEETDRTRIFALVGFSKTLGEIEITLDDQKGIEDNAGGWPA